MRTNLLKKVEFINFRCSDFKTLIFILDTDYDTPVTPSSVPCRILPKADWLGRERRLGRHRPNELDRFLNHCLVSGILCPHLKDRCVRLHGWPRSSRDVALMDETDSCHISSCAWVDGRLSDFEPYICKQCKWPVRRLHCGRMQRP